LIDEFANVHGAEEDDLETAAFKPLVNNYEEKVLYSAGPTPTGKVDVPISQGGTFYLAFSNAFWVLADKDVFAEG
jgi:hypothetical protein